MLVLVLVLKCRRLEDEGEEEKDEELDDSAAPPASSRGLSSPMYITCSSSTIVSSRACVWPRACIGSMMNKHERDARVIHGRTQGHMFT